MRTTTLKINVNLILPNNVSCYDESNESQTFIPESSRKLYMKYA